VGRDKSSLTGTAKVTHTSEARQGIHLLLPTGRPGVQPFPGKQGSITHNGDLGGQKPNVSPLSPSSDYWLGMMP